jgi:hypothetical protein
MKIVFDEQFGNQRDLFVMDAGSTHVIRLTDTAADEFDPAWQSVVTSNASPTPTPTT